MIGVALLMGLLGSLHCIGMCGTLALSLSAPSRVGNNGWLNPIRYNAGRVLTYSLMGLAVALLGEPLRIAGWQQGLSIFGGVVMLVAALGYFIPMHFAKATNPLTKAMLGFRGYALQRLKRLGGLNKFALGVLNGLLPCGIVYMAIGGAAMQRSFTDVALFMALFGLGTVPTMLVMGYSTSWLKPKGLALVKRVYPYALLLVAALLILRGMNLGVPYLSPAFEQAMSGCTAHCCR